MDEEIIRSDPNRTIIPEFIVDAVCHVPYCAPFLHPGYYDRDNAFYLNWDKVTGPVNQPGLAGRMGVWVKNRANTVEARHETHQR